MEALALMTVAAIRGHTGSYSYGFLVLLVLGAVGATAVATPSPVEEAAQVGGACGQAPPFVPEQLLDEMAAMPQRVVAAGPIAPG
jgi:hypothetical protein